MDPAVSPAMQDYLKGLYALGAEASSGKYASTTAVAGHMGVSAASATNMLKRLAALGLVRYAPYQGAALTRPGLKIALEIIRHHRLLETYLVEALGMPWEGVHAEAEVLEHVLSEALEDRMAQILGDPASDPHGHPIPTKEGAVPRPSGSRLWDAAIGVRVVVKHVPDHDPAALLYLSGLGVTPGATVEVVGRGPVHGPLFVRSIDSDPHGAAQPAALSQELAEAMWVTEERD